MTVSLSAELWPDVQPEAARRLMLAGVESLSGITASRVGAEALLPGDSNLPPDPITPESRRPSRPPHSAQRSPPQPPASVRHASEPRMPGTTEPPPLGPIPSHPGLAPNPLAMPMTTTPGHSIPPISSAACTAPASVSDEAAALESGTPSGITRFER